MEEETLTLAVLSLGSILLLALSPDYLAAPYLALSPLLRLL